MSILSSTRSGKYADLTDEALKKLGYIQVNSTFYRDKTMRQYITRNHIHNQYNNTGVYQAYLIITQKLEQEGYRGYVYINNIYDLKRLERFWDEKNQKHKAELKKQLLSRR